MSFLLSSGSRGNGRIVSVCIGVAAFVILAVSCRPIPRVPASGRISGYSITTTVDHEIAKRYLERRELPKELQELRRAFVEAKRVPSRGELERIARAYSPDVATLFFLESMAEGAEARELRKRFESELETVERLGPEKAAPRPASDLMILMVPGWFYVSHGEETNGDFHVQRSLYEKWGIEHRLVPIDENGSLDENAKTVADSIRRWSRDHRVFVVSASKSGAEVALALGRNLREEETRAVVGWLSIVGAVRGSPLADKALDSPFCSLIRAQLAVEGFDLSGLKSLRATTSRASFRALRFPARLRIVSLVAVPLSGQISDRASFMYGHLRDLGPNDGLTLLADEMIPGAVPLFIPGADHFLGPGDQRAWSTAVFRTLLDRIPNR